MGVFGTSCFYIYFFHKQFTKLLFKSSTASESEPSSNMSDSDPRTIKSISWIESIIKAAFSGKIGDGKIFVSNIEQVMRIRTGEKGSDAV